MFSSARSAEATLNRITWTLLATFLGLAVADQGEGQRVEVLAARGLELDGAAGGGQRLLRVLEALDAEVRVVVEHGVIAGRECQRALEGRNGGGPFTPGGSALSRLPLLQGFLLQSGGVHGRDFA